MPTDGKFPSRSRRRGEREAAVTTNRRFSFGAFTADRSRRTLEYNGRVVAIGERAFDTLIVLLENAGQLVTSGEILRQVWPGDAASGTNLRFQIASLRKILSSLDPETGHIINVAGRGYQFAAQVTTDAGPATNLFDRLGSSGRESWLPLELPRMVGRDEAVRAVARRLLKMRFVTIVGPGGVGKTTIAISIGHAVRAAYPVEVFFIDLAAVSDPQLVPSLLCLAFGLAVVSQDPLPAIIAFLRDESALLILDSCEHVIETVAAIAERLFREAPTVSILATSRELLNVHGEHIFRLAPLETPPDSSNLTAADALTYPATRLFVERAEATSGVFELNDVNAPLVADICGRLDGIPLAIEMGASLSASRSRRHSVTIEE